MDQRARRGTVLLQFQNKVLIVGVATNSTSQLATGNVVCQRGISNVRKMYLRPSCDGKFSRLLCPCNSGHGVDTKNGLPTFQNQEYVWFGRFTLLPVWITQILNTYGISQVQILALSCNGFLPYIIPSVEQKSFYGLSIRTVHVLTLPIYIYFWMTLPPSAYVVFLSRGNL